MKKLVFATLSLCSFTASLAQSTAYVIFNPSCMEQMEYRYTYSGESIFAYSYKPNADEQYIFMSGSSGIPQQSRPESAFNCNNFSMTDEALKIVNGWTDSPQMYILMPQDNGGYLKMPIYSVTQVKRYGSWYLLVAPQFTFAIDTTQLRYDDNLQGESSPTIIRFSGTQLVNCRYRYVFNGEPARGYTESTEFEFIYGIGITKISTGSNKAELEESEIQIASVNGQKLDNYLASICPQRNNQPYNADYNTPNWTNPAPPNNNIDYGYAGNKSVQSANWQQRGNPGASANLADCPIPPGTGYHVVQPRESLNAIARTYKVDVKSLIKWNNLKNPDYIEVCQQIWLQEPSNGNIAAKGYNSFDHYNQNSHKHGPYVTNQAIYQNTAQQAPSQYSGSNEPTVYYSTPSGTGNLLQKSAIQTNNHQQQELPPIHEYIARQGETLNSIAFKHNMSVAELAVLNSLAQGDKIPAGSRLVVRRYANKISAPTTDIQSTTQPTQYSYTKTTPDEEVPVGMSISAYPTEYSYNPNSELTAFRPPETANSSKHTVQEGEDMTRIAERYGYTPEYFRHINRALQNKLPKDDYEQLSPGLVLSTSDCGCQRSDFSSYKPSKQSEKAILYSFSNDGKLLEQKKIIEIPNNPLEAHRASAAQPQAQSRSHTVKSGESLASIAREHNVTIEKLVAANNIRSSQKLKLGRVLIIPK